MVRAVEINGKTYRTISDAARELKVSVKAVNEWIRKRVIRRPPTIEMGLKTIQIFPEDYMAQARLDIAAYKKKKRERRNGE